ncbi:unnamed protein product, partial [Ectocarpus sp. 8 AP-2014]
QEAEKVRQKAGGVESMKGVFWTVCAVSGFASVSQAFLQPSSIIASSATRRAAADTRTRNDVSCRMSAGDETDGASPALKNPFLVAAVGMALLSTD